MFDFRSGCYVYKPTMDVTCCPMYTIRCQAQRFLPSKSQRKVIKRVNRYLNHGVKPGGVCDQGQCGVGGGNTSSEAAPPSGDVFTAYRKTRLSPTSATLTLSDKEKADEVDGCVVSKKARPRFPEVCENTCNTQSNGDVEIERVKGEATTSRPRPSKPGIYNCLLSD